MRSVGRRVTRRLSRAPSAQRPDDVDGNGSSRRGFNALRRLSRAIGLSPSGGASGDRPTGVAFSARKASASASLQTRSDDTTLRRVSSTGGAVVPVGIDDVEHHGLPASAMKVDWVSPMAFGGVSGPRDDKDVHHANSGAHSCAAVDDAAFSDRDAGAGVVHGDPVAVGPPPRVRGRQSRAKLISLQARASAGLASVSTTARRISIGLSKAVGWG